MKLGIIFIFVAFFFTHHVDSDTISHLVDEFIDLMRRTGNLRVALTQLRVNEYVDEIMMQMNYHLIGGGLDPMILHDVDKNFIYEKMLLPLHGKLHLTNGVMKDFSKIRRSGSTTRGFVQGRVNIYIPFSIDRLRVSYDYSATFMGLGPSGTAFGEAKDVEIMIVLSVDTNSLKVQVDEVNMKANEFDLTFSNTMVTRWIIELFVNEVKDVILDYLIQVTQEKLKEHVQQIADTINAEYSGRLYN